MALAQALVVPAVMSESTYSLDIENLHISYDNPTDESLGNDSVDWNRLKAYAASLPYSIESNSTMQNLLDMYLMRIVQCIKAKDFEPGLLQWDSMIDHWLMLKYPVPLKKRVLLARLYYELCVLPGMPTHLLSTWVDGLSVLLHSKRKTSIRDLRLPWKPIFDILKKDLFLTRRQFEISQVPYYMGYIAEKCRRFFHAAAIEEMLETFLPLMNGTSLDSMLATQYYLVTFLPLSHPQLYLPLMFRMWDSINSYMWDERMLSFLGQLAEMHVDPTLSDPALLSSIPDDARSDGERRPKWNNDDLKASGEWCGLFKDVGIFTDAQWATIMSKCLTSMEISLADTGSLATGSTADSQAGFEISRLPKATWRIYSLAKILVYSMFHDGQASTIENGVDAEYFPLRAPSPGGRGSYLAGCKALDSLSRMITSTESFFHPSTSGPWTSDLSAFIKYLASEFNKRWYSEQKIDCKTPVKRRLTPLIKRELVRCLRTPALLAIFSRDSTTVSNIQSCFKSMTIMEPDLILQPILERAIPSLETLVETRRTTAIIKALGAITLSLTSREIYYPGSKHLLQILDLLLPGIDLNDPTKTLCTAAFLVEMSQCIKIGDLTEDINAQVNGNSRADDFFSNVIDEADVKMPAENDDIALSKFQEDALLKDSSRAFPAWTTAFIRRVILLFENLPGDTGTEVRSSSETEIVDAVIEACSQVCIHLSDALYDLVLNLIYDYASTTVRPNCVHVVHRLVECVANANPPKAIEKFLPFCMSRIENELQNGASSIRTTSTNSAPLPSDATFHWTLGIVRGLVRSDGKAVRALAIHSFLFKLLSKAFTPQERIVRVAAFASKKDLFQERFLSCQFVNPDEWYDESFQKSHYLHWGKLYGLGEAKINWHTPSDAEIGFALDIFSTIIKPSLDALRTLLSQDYEDPGVWQNEFCRHMSFVRNAFAGISTLWREHVPSDDLLAQSLETSDILNEIPEFIATVEPLSAGFGLQPGDPRHSYISDLRQEFGDILLTSSRFLRNKGPENTFASSQALLRSVRTFMLAYGDSRDTYNTLRDRYEAEYNLALQHVGQKVWPRALYVHKAQFYHVARLRWNSVERFRGPLQDNIIDETLEWCLWHYPTIRSASQTLLEDICKSYDGVRRRSLPKLYDALTPDAPDHRVKGALWLLNSSSFARYAMSEPTLILPFIRKIFFCQAYEESSVQKCVATIIENCLGQFYEPSYIIYELHSPPLSRAVDALEAALPKHLVDDGLVEKAGLHTRQRIESDKCCIMDLTISLTKIAESPQTHWKYSIVALRLLRTLIRRDIPIHGPQLIYFLKKVTDTNPSMRYYAIRSVMKASRYIKLRTFCRADPRDLALGINRNPLKVLVAIDNPSERYTQELLLAFRETLDPLVASKTPLLKDRMKVGWLVWGSVDERYLAPPPTHSDYLPWTSDNATAIEILMKTCCSEDFWNSMSIYFAEETNQRSLSTDNISCTKSIFQLLLDAPLLSFQKVVLKFLKTDDQNKQRAAAELLAGVIGGSKHWTQENQARLWVWLIPLFPQMLGSNVKLDTLTIWTSFLEYISWHRDPRRIAPLINYVFEKFETTDFNGASSSEAIKVASFHRGLAEEMGWKFTAWIDTTIDRYWKEIASEHDEVRGCIAEAFALTTKLTWRPKPSVPSTSYLVKEARVLPVDFDLLGVRSKYHAKRVQYLVNQFPIWREARIPGPRAFESTYDRVGILVCKWLFLAIHDVQAVSVFDYVLPLMPELFRFGEVNDNDELVTRSNQLLVRMCGVTPPVDLIRPLLGHIFNAIMLSPSYRTRLSALRLLQIWCFRQGGYLLSEDHTVREILDVVSTSLDDEKIEVRETAGTTLSGILRSSPKDPILALKKRFVGTSQGKLPSRDSPAYHEALRKLHGALIGICALVDAFPYTIEPWMPELLTKVLAEHVYDPPPLAGTVRKCASDFRKSHIDTWQEDITHFTEEELSTLSTMLSGNTYYA